MENICVKRQRMNALIPNIEFGKNDLKSFSIIYEKKRMEESKVFDNLEFHFDQDKLIYSHTDKIGVIRYGDDMNKFEKYKIRCKMGVDLVKLVSDNRVALTSPSDIKYEIQFVNFDVYKFGFSIVGHKRRINSLSTYNKGKNKILLSSSEDKTVRLWDRRLKNPLSSLVNVFASPFIAFHPLGRIFAVASDSHVIEMYDTLQLKFPLYQVKLFEKDDKIQWKGLKFSHDGSYLLITTNSSVIYLVDATDGKLLSTIQGFENVNKEDYDACFDQFSNLIFYGSSDHKLHVWNITQQQEMMKFSMPQDRTVKKIAFSMNRMIFATAGGNHLQLWNETQYSE